MTTGSESDSDINVSGTQWKASKEDAAWTFAYNKVGIEKRQKEANKAPQAHQDKCQAVVAPKEKPGKRIMNVTTGDMAKKTCTICQKVVVKMPRPLRQVHLISDDQIKNCMKEVNLQKQYKKQNRRMLDCTICSHSGYRLDMHFKRCLRSRKLISKFFNFSLIEATKQKKS